MKYSSEITDDKTYTFLSLMISIFEYNAKKTTNKIRGKILTKEILVKKVKPMAHNIDFTIFIFHHLPCIQY
mgnify:FL=1